MILFWPQLHFVVATRTSCEWQLRQLQQLWQLATVIGIVDIVATVFASCNVSQMSPQGNSISGKQDNYEHVKCFDKSHAALHSPKPAEATAIPMIGELNWQINSFRVDGVAWGRGR